MHAPADERCNLDKIPATGKSGIMKSKYEKGTRSYIMSRIRSKETKPEMIVRRFLYHHGFRYRLHVKELPGKPDIVLRRVKAVSA